MCFGVTSLSLPPFIAGQRVALFNEALRTV